MRWNFDIFVFFSWETHFHYQQQKICPWSVWVITAFSTSFEILHTVYNSLCYKITALFQTGFILKALERFFKTVSNKFLILNLFLHKNTFWKGKTNWNQWILKVRLDLRICMFQKKTNQTKNQHKHNQFLTSQKYHSKNFPLNLLKVCHSCFISTFTVTSAAVKFLAKILHFSLIKNEGFVFLGLQSPGKS